MPLAGEGVVRLLVPVAALLTTIVACSFLYDPRLLPPEHADAGDDAMFDPIGDPAIDAPLEGDAAMTSTDAGVTSDTASPPSDTSTPAPDTSAPPPDADVPPPDTSAPPDAPECGGLGEACCASNLCGEWLECSGGACRACGGLLQSCCDPGATCKSGGLCVLGNCT